MERFINKLTLGFGAPLLLAALIGGAIALAQDGGDTPAPTPAEEAAPGDDASTPETAPGDKSEKRGHDDCPGGRNGGGDQSDEGSSLDSGV